MQLLGLGHCRDTMVGDGGLMVRGISGGERKRLTTAEMVVGPQRVLLMDEISTGLDSATLHSVITFFVTVSRNALAQLHTNACLQEELHVSDCLAFQLHALLT